MIGDWRRRIGSFGIGRVVASVAAFAVIAVSPVIASLADAHLDGVGLAVAEAVFGEPVCAQECEDRFGNPRTCTITERFALCLMAAEDNFLQCVDTVPWWLLLSCGAALGVDTAACTVQIVTGTVVG